MTLSNNPAYQVAFESKVHNLKLYAPAGTEYHTSRYMAAGAQDIFSASGASRDYLKRVAETVKDWCNDTTNNKAQLRTDVGTMMDNLLYRLQYPVDELCALRMGAIFCFMEDEDPNSCQDFFTQRKVMLATGNLEKGLKADPELYTFFLTLGVESTPSYKDRLGISIDTDYFNQRREILQGLTPPRCRIE
jgi:hypothetical protein